MSNHTDTTRKVMEMVSITPTSDLEDVIVACRDLTWNQIFTELDRLTRSGHIILQQIQPGRYRVMPGHEATTTSPNS